MGGVLVTKAWTQRGWSSNDHLIDDSRMDEIIGREFKTLEGARRAVAARADRRGYGAFEYELSGRRYRYDDSPSIPGRDVARIREIG